MSTNEGLLQICEDKINEAWSEAEDRFFIKVKSIFHTEGADFIKKLRVDFVTKVMEEQMNFLVQSGISLNENSLSTYPQLLQALRILKNSSFSNYKVDKFNQYL